MLRPERPDRILLLDLWLFGSAGKEEDFLRELSDAVLKKYPDDNTDDSWVRDIRDDTKAIRAALKRQDKIAQQPGYDRFRTLLARFVACNDHTLPIILFSSTGKRTVVEPLKQYKNIITSVPKPQCLAGVSSELIEGFSESLSEAFRQAKRILEAGRVVRHIREHAQPVSQSSIGVDPLGGGNAQKEDTFYHIELFLDESEREDTLGHKTLSVGGCYAIFKGSSPENAVRSSWQFDDDLVENGIRFFYRNGTLPKVNEDIPPLKKRPANLKLFEKAYDKSQHKPLQIGFIKLGKEPSSQNKRGRVDPDNRELVRDLLETFLYEACPGVLGGDWVHRPFSFSVYGATRIWPTQEDALKKLKYAYGVGHIEDELFVKSMLPDGLLPFIVDLESFRGGVPAMDRALAVRLIYEYDAKGKRDIPKILQVVCIECHQTFEARTIAQTKAGRCEFRKDSEGHQIAFLTPIDRSTNGLNIFLNPRWAKLVASHPQCTYFSYEAGSNTDLTTQMVRWRATMVQPIQPGTEQERALEKEVAQGIWTISGQQLGRCAQCDFRPDYKALHYMADWALGKPEQFCFKGVLDLDDQVDGEHFSNWLSAGRALDAKELPRALREAAEVLASDDPSIPEKSIGRFVVLRLNRSLSNLTTKDFFEFVENLRQPLNPSRTAPVIRSKTNAGKPKKRNSNKALLQRRSSAHPALSATAASAGQRAQPLGESRTMCVTIVLDTGADTVDQVQQSLIGKGSSLHIDLTLVAIEENTTPSGGRELELTFDSDCDETDKRLLRNAYEELKVRRKWKELSLRWRPVSR